MTLGSAQTCFLSVFERPIAIVYITVIRMAFRPISLMSSCCKLLEHILSSQITSFLESKNILGSFQHGFRKKLSTTTQIVSVIHDFANAINNRKQIDAIFFNLSKAFDRVPHSLLIRKMQRVGIAPRLVDWISAYLENRTQFVEINGCQSQNLDVLSGVPQGSVLGPLLFVIYVNDICNDLDAGVTVKMFADDCVIYTTVSSPLHQSLLNENLCKIADWCERRQMVINYSKTCALTITHKKTPLEYKYHVRDQCIEFVNNVKYLGLTINTKLSWDAHIDNVCAKAYKKLCFLRRKLGSCDWTVKLAAYRTLVRPVMEYASFVWDPYLKKDIDKVERIQRLRAQFIFSDFMHLSSVSEMLNKCGLEPLECRRRIARLIFLYKLYNNESGLNKELYILPPPQRSARLNHSKTVRPYAPKNNTFKYSFFVRTVDDWNSLPSDCVHAPTSSSFDFCVKNLM